MSTMNPEGF